MADATEKLERHSRNLFVVATAIIIYLFAGADLDKLAVLGIRSPAEYPIIFSWAAVGALFWFWWRYLIAWVDSDGLLTYRRGLSRNLYRTKPFTSYIKKEVDLDKITEKLGKHAELEFFSVVENESGGLRVVVQNAHFKAQNKSTHAESIDEKGLGQRIRIPIWLYVCVVVPHFFWRAIRSDQFANLILPHIIFAIACLLIAAKTGGVDPAGLFGVLVKISGKCTTLP